VKGGKTLSVACGGEKKKGTVQNERTMCILARGATRRVSLGKQPKKHVSLHGGGSEEKSERRCGSDRRRGSCQRRKKRQIHRILGPECCRHSSGHGRKGEGEGVFQGKEYAEVAGKTKGGNPLVQGLKQIRALWKNLSRKRQPSKKKKGGHTPGSKG